MGSTNSSRFLMIDGLRGIAAIMVVFYHLYGNLKEQVSSWVPATIDTLVSHGNIGVQIFFVISGFVIAYSVGDKQINLKYIGTFALRRSIRLDPPYWLSIITAIFLTYLSTALFSEIHRELPSAIKILSHLAYMQDMLGYGNIISVYWTLCLEVQFYLLFVILIALFQKFNETNSTQLLLQTKWVKWALFLLGILSICNYFDIYSVGIKHTFLPYWHNFFLGILICWCIRGWLNPMYFLAFWITLLGFAVYFEHETNVLTSLITSMAVFIAGVRGQLSKVFSSTIYQYLGKISYSLYLFHPIIGWRVISIGKRYLGPELNILEGTALFVSGIMVSIFISHAVFIYVEKPTIAFSRRFKLNSEKN
jgi:peptidoglycan/LPS O-acetylase OafA/YrhL